MDTTLAEVREDMAILRLNIAALRLRNAWLAELLERIEPAAGAHFEISGEENALCGSLDGKALASKRRPLTEAGRWASAIDLEEHAVVVVHGFGLGHHVAALAERCDDLSAILVVEPDIRLLRAVLARVDHSSWLKRREVRFVPNASEVAPLSVALRGLEAPLSFGVCVAVHPASASRLANEIDGFNKAFPAAVGAIRTHIITTLMQSDTTFRNALANARLYAGSPGIGELRDIARGRLGVVVSAGPSLKRNVALLNDPGVRSRCVVVAVQTVLKPLLAMGIRPDFVTAIDYAEISKRFYEGLTPEDVDGITLVSTGRANPAIHEAWPGVRRLIEEDVVCTALGEDLSRSPDGLPRGELPSAATVAHLSYSLARYLGCDPVALIGQDLAFTDGQYYADGAAIHTTWGGEVNPFNTLEMLEWQRIVRMRSYLHERKDHLGRRVYTDEQMATYAAQFEQMFASDEAKGLVTIDATEGGIAKRCTRIMTLAEAIERHANPASEPIAAMPLPRDYACAERDARVRERLAEVRRGVRRIARLSRDTESLLDRLDRHAEDTERANKIVKQVHENRDEVHTIEPAWTLLQRLNQTAALKRYSADRKIARASALSEIERFRLRVERDRVNVRWMGEVGDHLDEVLAQVDASFDGGALPVGEAHRGDGPAGERVARVATRAWAVLVDHGGLGGRSSWECALTASGMPPVRLLVERLARSTRLRGVMVLTDRAGLARELLGDSVQGLSVRVIDTPAATDDESLMASRARRVARLVAGSCWRGGIGGMTVFDEPFDAPRIVGALARAGAMESLDAAVVMGIDWCFVDPAIVDRMIEQHEEAPEQFGIMFTQALPGLSPALVSRKNLEGLAVGQQDNASGSSFGGTLGYTPTNPRPDPVGRANCLPLEGVVRDAGVRMIPDTARGRASVRAAMERLGSGVVEADAAALAASASGAAVGVPTEIVVNAGPPVRCAGEAAAWYGPRSGGGTDATGASAEGLHRVLASLGDAAGDALVTIGLGGWRGWTRVCPAAGERAADPLDGEGWMELVSVARRHGVGAVHLRTDLRRRGDAQRVLDAGIDIVSVDAWANDAALYERLTGVDGMRRVFENLQALLEGRRVARGLPTPWVVPRITRCDATYETIEAFYDKWLVLAGAAAIDPLPMGVDGQRIAPLTLPGFVDRRLCAERMVLLSDGCIARDDGVFAVVGSPADALEGWAGLVRARLGSADDAWRTASRCVDNQRTEAA